MENHTEYHTIDQVIKHFRSLGSVILTNREMNFCGIEYLCNEKGLWIIKERLHYDKRVPLSHPHYYILADLESYLPDKHYSAITIFDMRERLQYGQR